MIQSERSLVGYALGVVVLLVIIFAPAFQPFRQFVGLEFTSPPAELPLREVLKTQQFHRTPGNSLQVEESIMALEYWQKDTTYVTVSQVSDEAPPLITSTYISNPPQNEGWETFVCRANNQSDLGKALQGLLSAYGRFLQEDAPLLTSTGHKPSTSFKELTYDIGLGQPVTCHVEYR